MMVSKGKRKYDARMGEEEKFLKLSFILYT